MAPTRDIVGQNGFIVGQTGDIVGQNGSVVGLSGVIVGQNGFIVYLSGLYGTFMGPKEIYKALKFYATFL